LALSDPSLVWLLALLTVGLPVAAVVLWHRIPGPRPVVLSARLASVVASQLAAVLLVGVALNDYAYFYGSWGDLWSSVTQTVDNRYPVSPVTYRHQASGARPAGVTLVASGTAPQSVPPARWPRAGRLESVHIQGDVSQLGTQAYVYLPPQYFQPRYRSTTFPAVEVFSGYPSTDTMLVQRLALQRKLAAAIARHQARPMILVMMQPTITLPRDTECTNVPGGPQVETFYAQDVPRAIGASYRVSSTGWAAMGASTGGYCATKLAMDYPVVFRAAVSMSGYYQALRDYTTGNLWGGSRQLRNLNSPEWRLRHQPAPPISLLVTSSKGEAGPYGIQDTRRFLSLVRPPMQVSSIIAPSGGHNFSTWSPEVPAALRWLSAHLYASGPGGPAPQTTPALNSPVVRAGRPPSAPGR
jgi:enterochelin esterase-like enzyme